MGDERAPTRWWYAEEIPPEVPPLRPHEPGRPDRPWPIVPRPGRTPPAPERPPVGRDSFVVTLDLADRLLQRRIVLLSGELDHDAATRAAAQLMLLDSDAASDDGEPVDLHVRSVEGDLDAAITLAETIDLMRVPVRALATGWTGTPAIAVFAAADRRRAHPH